MKRIWTNCQRAAVVAWLAYGQLTARPMRQAKQCPGCLSRHHGADRYCPPCEVKRQLVELAIAAVVVGLAFGLGWTLAEVVR